jgi:hypothetical protein
LLTVEDAGTTVSGRPGREILAEGINELPVFWGSLFAEGDTRLDVYHDRTRVRNWCVRTEKAIRRVTKVDRRVTELLDGVSGRVWGKWVRLISRQKAAFLKVNAVEVRALDPRRYDGYRRVLSRAFSEPGLWTMKGAARRNGLEFSETGFVWDAIEYEVLACKLAGADHIRKVPWLGRGAVGLGQDEGGSRNVYDDIFESISPAESLEEAVRKAREIMRGAAGRKGLKHK